MTTMTFPQFPNLPPELQTQIWETCLTGPCMHIFDVCFPSRSPGRVERAFAGGDVTQQARFDRFKETVFLDRVEAERGDPSMYRYANTLRHTSHAAAWTAEAASRRDGPTTVSLPGRDAKLSIAGSDVLMLQFRDAGDVGAGAGAGEADADTDTLQSRIGPVLRCQWSAELAATLQGARKVALDAVEGWVFSPNDTLGWDEITHLASTLHRDLEVLYLVESGASTAASRLQTRGTLWKRLEGDANGLAYPERPGDVVRAVGMRYTEVFDLETLGWHECHPTYGFAFLMTNAIRLHQHQGGQSVFKGIRVLVAEDEGTFM
ncbi:hypothetical protein B0J13DRAFT_59141 [Dactylonectria estremocensis]|uniref:2EXR domain-containing protein n=1 Tax=Dactylonectria estremocensis TaxID=1079267 RepID=A0A9P9EKY9_9HYPO|nr:hypothetical protein B0J13DRAFT_59141 [Dactylonectria estremocensis]